MFWIWSGSLVVHIASYIGLFQTWKPLYAVGWELGAAGMLVSLAALALSFGLFGKIAEADRSLRFIRAAYAWGIFSFAQLLLLPVYNRLAGTSFSHAYFGSYRHAFTVGFISMMIVGVSSKVAPVLAGADQARLNSLRLSFWLINAGCAMRVGFQVLTDLFSWAFPVTALSAWVEITGFSIWSVDLWRTISTTWSPRDLLVGIAPDSKVYDVITLNPETEEVFLRYGFSLIGNPVARRVFARSVTLAQACRLKGVHLDEFLGALQAKSRTSLSPAPEDHSQFVVIGQGKAVYMNQTVCGVPHIRE